MMEVKYLWSIIDLLRDALKDMKEENDDLKAYNDSLKDEAVKWNRKYNKLQDEASKPTFH